MVYIFYTNYLYISISVPIALLIKNNTEHPCLGVPYCF